MEVIVLTQQIYLYATIAAVISQKIATERMFDICLHPDWIFWRTDKGKAARKCVDEMNRVTDEIVRQKKKEYLENVCNANVNSESDDDYCTKKLPLLELLFKLKNAENVEWTDEELRHEVLTMLGAGSETSALTISYLLVLLGMHPQIQEQVYLEMHEIFGTSTRRPELEDLSKMKFLEATIKETMRLYPILPFIVRASSEDIFLGDKTLPAGTTCMIGIYSLHRNPKLWEDPDKFDPGRFSPENTAKRPSNYYIPFACGPRNCIGVKFAMTSISFIVSSILRNFEISCDYKLQDVELKFQITLLPVNGYHIRLRPREPRVDI